MYINRALSSQGEPTPPPASHRCRGPSSRKSYSRTVIRLRSKSCTGNIEKLRTLFPIPSRNATPPVPMQLQSMFFLLVDENSPTLFPVRRGNGRGSRSTRGPRTRNGGLAVENQGVTACILAILMGNLGEQGEMKRRKGRES